MTTPVTQAEQTEIERTPRYAVEQWKNKEIDGTTLMRKLMAWDKWCVIISEQAAVEMLATNAVPSIMISRDPEGVGRLFIFSDSAALNIYREQAGVEGEMHYLTVHGTWIFRTPLDGISEIVIDAYSPTDIYYTEQHFENLRATADAVEVEEALTNLRFQPEMADEVLPIVRDYAGYIIAVDRVEDGMVLVMAPDSQGRQLAAVFTSQEAFDAFYPEGKQGYPDGELVMMTQTGTELFALLLKMELDGMVFNCCGPVRPIAFAAGISQVVLDTVPQQETSAA